MGNPDFLLFDKPTTELDPEERARFKEIIRRLDGEKKCIVISTHIVEDVESVCDRVIIFVYCIYLNLFDTLHMFQFLSVFPLDVRFVEWDNGMAAKALVSAFVFLAGGMFLFRVRRIYK